MIAPRMKWLKLRVGLATLLVFCTGCNALEPRESSTTGSKAETAVVVAAPVSVPVAAPPVVAAIAISTLKLAPVTVAPKHASQPAAESAVTVKRFVVASGVKDREPLTSTDALPADGSAIYAFAELANPLGQSENVRITFERKGGAERVGDVMLPVPGNVTRHRTWAFTHFIRAAGVWEAVLWSESGTELGRVSFEVKGPATSGV